ncbi:MAG: NRDE family protein [Haloferacaceae archaeon]
MCTLTIAWQVFADAPVAVAANRDEALDRPSEPPTRVDADPVFVAPRDAEAGGTWIGYNEYGVFVGVTNRWRDVEGGGERSRGLLVRDALGAESAEDAARLVEREVARHRYDAFNLVVADANAAVFVQWNGHLAVRNLEPGVHVVVNVGAALGGGGFVEEDFFVPEARPEVGAEQAADARRVREALTAEPGESADEWLDRAASVLGDHQYGVCVHGDGYGTRSSSLVKLGAERRYEFAPGPPCQTAYETVEGQL